MDAKLVITSLFFFVAGAVAGIVISGYYYEPLSVAISRWGGFYAMLLPVIGFIAGVFVEKIRKQKFKPVVVGRVEQAGMDVIKAINATTKRAGFKLGGSR